MRKIYKTVILLTMVSMLMSPVIAVDNQSANKSVTYRILIDQHYGFFRTYEMYDKLLGKEMFQENNTLNISKGDIVIFASDTMPDAFLTVISEEKLWSDKKGALKYSGKEFNYTFNKSGIYNMYIKEHYLLKQRIIVGPIDINDTNETWTNTTKPNLTNDTKPSLTNVTKTQNSTNTTESNLAIKQDQNSTGSIKQNSTINKSGSSPIISISLANSISSKIRSKSDVSILTMILFGIYILSARIKDD